MAEIITFAPSPSIFGFGALTKLREALKSRGFVRILLVTDPHIAEGRIFQRVVDSLKGSLDVEVFDRVPAEPKSHEVDEQRENFGSDFDALLALGGGSPMDFAKALSIIMTHGGALGDYLTEGSVPGPVTPVVCVPTTSGTGSQSTQTTVFTLDGVKRGVSSEYIRPVFSVVDPELTMDLPPEVTRNSGYDALMHACESFFARPFSEVPDRPIFYQGSNPFSRSLSLEAFRSIWQAYPRAVHNGNERTSRMLMSMGSHLAGIAFSHSGLGLVHALASALGGLVDAPHGVCLAACTDIALRYNLKACESDFETLARIITDIDTFGTHGTCAEDFIYHLAKLIDDLKLPSRPSQLGIKKEDAQTLLRNTLVQTRRTKTNPRPLDDEFLFFIESGI